MCAVLTVTVEEVLFITQKGGGADGRQQWQRLQQPVDESNALPACPVYWALFTAHRSGVVGIVTPSTKVRGKCLLWLQAE